MSGAGKHALLDYPGIWPDLQHVQIVIRFEDQTIGFAQMYFDEFRYVAKIGANSDLAAVSAEGEANRVGGVVGNGESVHVNIANRKTLSGLNRLRPLQSLPECIGKNALQRVHGRPGHVKRRFPESEDLRQAVAVVSVFVGDQNGVEAVNFPSYGSETGESFTLSKAGVNKDAGAFGFEQCQIARTAGRKNGDAQADGNSPRRSSSQQNFQDDGRAEESRQCRLLPIVVFLELIKSASEGDVRCCSRA